MEGPQQSRNIVSLNCKHTGVQLQHPDGDQLRSRWHVTEQMLTKATHQFLQDLTMVCQGTSSNRAPSTNGRCDAESNLDELIISDTVIILIACMSPIVRRRLQLRTKLANSVLEIRKSALEGEVLRELLARCTRRRTQVVNACTSALTFIRHTCWESDAKVQQFSVQSSEVDDRTDSSMRIRST